MKVIPLGTVSPYCKEDKNCPGFLVTKDGYKILLDCGSGISRLLSFPEDLNNLIIIISHLHKDHYSDLASIGYASFVYKNLGLLKNKIKVYIPRENTFSQDYEYLTNFGDEHYMEFIPYKFNSLIKHDNFTVSFSLNPHQVTTHSIKINNNSKTLVYSSDTGYKNNSLEAFAKDADLLICEATFLDCQAKKSDNHLYAYEAALIAKNAHVKKLTLTHFWPEINEQNYVNEAKKIFSNTDAAIEGKQIII